MYDFDHHEMKRLRPVWLGGLIGLIGGAVLFLVMQPYNWHGDVRVMVPAHDIYGGLHLYDIRKVPFLMPVLGLLVGLMVKMYRDALGHHRRRAWRSRQSQNR
ncbi:MAG: hypothetical protein L0Y71_09885 [Gemmataceae bacterium]|nr:hypothetical protein [Gemmataceae bacterium]